VVSHITLGINSARRRARIDAAEVVTYFIGGTFRIFNALGTTAAGVWVAFVAGTALANSAETTSQTLCIGTAAEARARIAIIIAERIEGVERVETAKVTTANHRLSVARKSAERIVVAAATERR